MKKPHGLIASWLVLIGVITKSPIVNGSFKLTTLDREVGRVPSNAYIIFGEMNLSPEI